MKEARKYLNKRLINIITILKRPKRSYRPGTFHRLRVEIKKLDALFDLINDIAPDFRKKKKFNPFKAIFDRAGKVRDLQLEYQAMKKHFWFNALRPYKKKIKQEIKDARKDYFAFIDNALLREIKTSREEIKPFIEKMDRKKIDKYLSTKSKTLQRLMSNKQLPQDKMHALRIGLKSYYYILAMIDHPRASKDKLSSLLGKWHDLQVLAAHLQKAKNEIQNKKIIARLEKINNKRVRTSDRFLFKIYKTFPAATLPS